MKRLYHAANKSYYITAWLIKQQMMSIALSRDCLEIRIVKNFTAWGYLSVFDNLRYT